MQLNKSDLKFIKDLLGKKCGFAMGARPVGAVDEKQMVIHDVAVCIQGEALGHGVWLDEAFIRGVIEQGNASEMLCHFGHEDSNAGRIKNYMGVFANWIEKEAVGHDGEKGIGAYADIKFSKVAKAQGDNVDWVMGLARERPDALGLSIVFSVADYKVKTADGELFWSEYIAGLEDEIKTWDDWTRAVNGFFDASVDGRLYVVLGKLYGADFVAEGAATDGLFARGEIDADDPAAKLMEKFVKLAALSDGESAEQAQGGENADANADGGAEPQPEAQTQEGANADGGAEPQPEAQTQEGDGASQGEGAAAAAQEGEAVARMKAECDKRIAGFQSMHDKKMKELNGQIEGLKEELAKAKASASAFEKDLGEKVKELAGVVAERDSARERLAKIETAHSKLTGGALTIGEETQSVKTIAEFVKDHGGEFSRAVREDPETYRRICAAHGWKPCALMH